MKYEKKQEYIVLVDGWESRTGVITGSLADGSELRNFKYFADVDAYCKNNGYWLSYIIY